jgi:REP-associated tyrosine transposase
LELIRYIHLNPLRAKLVEDLKALDKYPWTGHSAILGRRKNPLISEEVANGSTSAGRRIAFPQFLPETEKAIINPENSVNPVKNKFLAEKTIEDVLRHFGKNLKEARRRYRQFVQKGIKQGRRPEFQGGGLVRSAGGEKAGLLGRTKEEREKGDQRILGSGDFVGGVLRKAGEEWESQTGPRSSLKALINTVSEAFDLSSQQLKSRSRRKSIIDARSVLARVAVRNYGYKGIEVAQALSLSPSQCHSILFFLSLSFWNHYQIFCLTFLLCHENL